MKPFDGMDERTKSLYIAATIAESVLSMLSRWIAYPAVGDALLRLSDARAAFRKHDPFADFVDTLEIGDD